MTTIGVFLMSMILPRNSHLADRGCTDACEDYQRYFATHGITCSMSRRADCDDNALMESFFATVRKERNAQGGWHGPRSGGVRHAQGLFATGLRLTPYSMWMNQYAVADDGQSFLLNRPVERPAATITALLPR